MNLRWFHALLIFCSAALAALVGVWSVDQYQQGGGAGMVAAAAAAFAVSLGLIVYDSWFLKKTRMLR
jgi:hypothetical protein